MTFAIILATFGIGYWFGCITVRDMHRTKAHGHINCPQCWKDRLPGDGDAL
jgi:hypothetical protein